MIVSHKNKVGIVGHVIIKLSTVFIKKGITSNRVEGEFCNFDLSVPVSGRKNFISYQNMVDRWLQPGISFDDINCYMLLKSDYVTDPTESI